MNIHDNKFKEDSIKLGTCFTNYPTLETSPSCLSSRKKNRNYGNGTAFLTQQDEEDYDDNQFRGRWKRKIKHMVSQIESNLILPQLLTPSPKRLDEGLASPKEERLINVRMNFQ